MRCLSPNSLITGHCSPSIPNLPKRERHLTAKKKSPMERKTQGIWEDVGAERQMANDWSGAGKKKIDGLRV